MSTSDICAQKPPDDTGLPDLKSLLNGLRAVATSKDASKPEVLQALAKIDELPDRMLARMVRCWVSEHLQKFGGDEYAELAQTIKR
jgi:hypothetical protein